MKKMIKIIGIIFLCLIIVIALLIGIGIIKNKIDSKKSWVSNTYYEDFKSDSKLEKKYSGLGEYKVSKLTIDTEDEAIDNYRIWYPSNIKDENKQYPLIVVVNASNTAALNYEEYFERLASWGFIVAGNDDRQSGTGLSASKTLNQLLSMNETNDNVLYNKVSQENIGIVGYSQGGSGAINAVIAFDNSNRFKTIFTGSAAYSVLSKNMGWGYDISKVNIPYFMTAGTGNSDDTGISDTSSEYGGVAPLSSLIENYNSITNEVFKIRARVVGAEHDEIQNKTDGYMTAWMLYQLQNDKDASTVFIGDDADILNNSNWQDIEKNS